MNQKDAVDVLHKARLRFMKETGLRATDSAVVFAALKVYTGDAD